MSAKNSKSKTSTCKRYYVLHCAADDSHVLLEETALLCDEQCLSLEDNVKFNFPGHKQPLDGTVKGMSGNYKEMCILQDKLNKISKPKRDPSFDSEQPRKAAMKCMKGLNIKPRAAAMSAKSTQPNPTKVPSKKSQSQDTNTMNSGKTSSAACLQSNNVYSDSESGSDSEQSSAHSNPSKRKQVDGGKGTLQVDLGLSSDVNDSLSDGDMTPEQLNLLDQLSRKKAATERRQMQSLMSSSNDSAGRSNHSEPVGGFQNDSNMLEPSEETTKEIPETNPTGSDIKSDNSSSDGEIMSVKMKAPAKRRKVVVKTPVNHITFEGEHFRFKETDPKVLKLHSDYDVFVQATDLKRLKGKASSGTALARGAVRLVFTDEALSHCSVSGKPSPGRNGIREVRTPLNSDGVQAILEFVKARLARHKLHCSETSLKQAMANFLCEERAKVPIPSGAEKKEDEEPEGHESSET